MRTISLFTIFFLFHLAAFAQKQDYVWCMGMNGGVNFNTNPPAVFQSKMNSIETTASVSDRYTGALLFYTDGHRIWDAMHQVMPNGIGVGQSDNDQSAVQGAVIVPFINDDNKYYVFVLSTPVVQHQERELLYSVVDMTLNNGRGDVLPGVKRVQIAQSFNESMTMIPGCEMAWVVTQNIKTGDFYAYKVSEDGVELQPVISPVNYPISSINANCMRASPDLRKIAVSSFHIDGPVGYRYLALHNFDVSTGKLSNGQMIDTTLFAYPNCEFSPKGKYLYTNTGDTVFQYDITLPAKEDITASRKAMGYTLQRGSMKGMQLRSDGNIYIVRQGDQYLDIISNCDARAPGCTYTSKAVRIGGSAFTNLPAWVADPKNYVTGTNTRRDTAICNGQSLLLKSNMLQAAWQDGNTATEYATTQAGVFWVKGYDADCKIKTDTFVVGDINLMVDIGSDTTICTGDTIVLQSNAQPAGATYLWSNGSTKDNIDVTDTGVYSLTISHNGCEDIDETTISHYPAVSIELGADTVICNDVQITLPQKTVAEEVDKYLWQDGSTGATLQVTASGRYFLTISSRCGAVSDTVTITKRNCSLYFPGAFSPNGDGKNDIARILGDVAALTDFTLNIYNRWGQKVFTTANPLLGWNGMHGASLADIGVYYYYMQYKYKGEAGSMKGDVTLVR